MVNFRVEYNNDTGPNDESFFEYWLVTNDELSFRVDSSQQDADWLAGVLNTQQPAAAVPDGYVPVPVEPTQAMLDAAGMCIVPEGKEWLDQSHRETWAAMLAAARKGASSFGNCPDRRKIMVSFDDLVRKHGRVKLYDDVCVEHIGFYAVEGYACMGFIVYRDVEMIGAGSTVLEAMRSAGEGLNFSELHARMG